MLEFIQTIPSPQQIKEMLPFDPGRKLGRDQEIRSVIDGSDRRILLVVGPCSAHDPAATIEYCERLAKLADQVKDVIMIVPRLYTTKPRSHGGTYRGMLHTPKPGMNVNFTQGILHSRQMMIDVFSRTGLSGADEMLYVSNYAYFDDLLSYAVVGSRSCENQAHRLSASGMDIPVGFKNPMNGNLASLADSVRVAQMPNTYKMCYDEVRSTGNAYAHGILRGYSGCDGILHVNMDEGSIATYAELCKREKVVNACVIVDLSHGNSGKIAENQIQNSLIMSDIINRNKFVRGLMIESFLLDGKQGECGTEFGKSITDECLGWSKTERLVKDLANRL